MNTSDVLQRSDVYATMQTNTPYKVYIKEILGKVLVKFWDNFTNTPAEVILYGDPNRKEETCMIKVWNEREDAYFKSSNRYHLKKGIVREYKLPEPVQQQERPIEQATDEELQAIINSKFFSLQKVLNTLESVAVLFRMKNLADEMEKSEKIIKAIEARISEVQQAEYLPKSEE